MTRVVGKNAPVPASTNRVAVLVLGMHRSGTSALARVLSLLGCDLPKTLMGASPANESGHWESEAIMRLNDEILSSAGSNWRDWLAFNSGWYSSLRGTEFKNRALTVLEEEFSQSRLFVLKDPRICRFAPFWLEVLETAGVQPVIILPVRNPLEVGESLARRDGIDPALGHLLWLRYVLEAERDTRRLPRFHISYQGLLNGWSHLISTAEEALGIRWPRRSTLVNEEIAAFLTEQLRHHRESASSVSDNPLLSAWLREAFAILNRWTEEGEANEDHAVLDRIRAELNAAAPAFSSLISSGQKSAQRAKALDASLKEAQSKLTKSEATAGTEQQRAETLAQDLQAATSRAQDQQAELAKLRAEVQSLRAMLGETRGHLSHVQSALAQRSAEADETTAELRDKKAELQKLRTEKSVVEGRLAERFSEIAAMTRLLAEKDSAARLSAEQVVWLRGVSAVLLNGSSTLKGFLESLLPAPIRYARQKARLKRKGIFDPGAYLAAYPDVAEAGLDPLRHYINHGMREGRQLQSDSDGDI